MMDALWQVMNADNVNISDMLIFLPSRRAVRSVEQMLVNRVGHSLILPHIVALGEKPDDVNNDIQDENVISNTELVVMLARMLSADAAIGNIATALPVAHDLMRMADYLENEGIKIADINWSDLVDSRYALHFQHKARILQIISDFMSQYCNCRQTQTAARNRGIRAWIDVLDKYSLVVVCGSTASVPATADLMAAVAARKNGRIILSGKISGRPQDLMLDTNPYNSEYKFLVRIGLGPDDVIPIDVGTSAIDFMNDAFGNNAMHIADVNAVNHCHLIECPHESTEADVAIEIAYRGVQAGKSVLIITPDAAGNQRIAMAAAARGLKTDFSGGIPATMTMLGRALLNMFDDWIERGSDIFDKIYAQHNLNLMQTIVDIFDNNLYEFAPRFDYTDLMYVPVFNALRELSDSILRAGINLNLTDARAFIADVLSAVSIRRPMNTDADVIVLGTIESRMQTADIVILTGLNDGMFPARGYENSWLPTRIATKIGLPSPDRKVSLMSLDFMNLSCGSDVYWLRSRVSGGAQVAESRFISRMYAAHGAFDTIKPTKSDGADGTIHTGVIEDILSVVRSHDIVAPNGLDYSAPQLEHPDRSDVYVTELELLINNPYAFYVRHLLRLQPRTDYWLPPDVRDFGILVHDVVESIKSNTTATDLVAEMDRRAREILGKNSISFYFWHKRFVEIADFAIKELKELKNPAIEINGVIKIGPRNVRARADIVWDGGVMDIKTGQAPSKTQLIAGTMPQLPLEAYMLQNGGFKIPCTEKSKTPVIRFLQLKNNEMECVPYNVAETQEMIDAAINKVNELFKMYSYGNAPYEYRDTTEPKYQAYDDLARNKD